MTRCGDALFFHQGLRRNDFHIKNSHPLCRNYSTRAVIQESERIPKSEDKGLDELVPKNKEYWNHDAGNTNHLQINGIGYYPLSMLIPQFTSESIRKPKKLCLECNYYAMPWE